MEAQKNDRRLVMRVLARWRELAGEWGLPRRSQIDPRHFGADWSHCLMLDVDPAPGASRFAFVGESLRDPTWPTFERQRVGECAEETLLYTATSYLDRVIVEREPLLEGVGLHIGSPVLYRSILLPLSENGSRIDGVLGAANFREAA
jgi:PAS domain-containing protein